MLVNGNLEPNSKNVNSEIQLEASRKGKIDAIVDDLIAPFDFPANKNHYALATAILDGNEGRLTEEQYNSDLEPVFYPSNKTSRKVFMKYTGVKLSKTMKGTIKDLRKWAQTRGGFDIDAIHVKKNAEHVEREKVKEQARQAEFESDPLHAFHLNQDMGKINPRMRGLRNKRLYQQVRTSNHGIITRREHVEKMVSNGAHPEIVQVTDTAKISRLKKEYKNLNFANKIGDQGKN